MVDQRFPKGIKVNELEAGGQGKRNEISLKELDLSSSTQSGVGDIVYTIPLNLTELGSIPDELFFRLYFAYTPLADREKADLKVFINKTLIAAYNLEREAKERSSFTVSIPGRELKAGLNDVDIVASYYPERGQCRGAMPKFSYTVFDESFFYWRGKTEEFDSISDFMNIVNGDVLFVVDEKNLYPQALAFLNLLGRMNKGIKSLDVKDVNQLDASGREYDFYIMFLTPQSAAQFDIPLKTENSFTVFNPLTNEVVFDGKYSEPFGALETFKYAGKPALAVTYSQNPAVLESFAAFAPKDIGRLGGNLAIFNQEIESFDVGKKLRVRYEPEKDLAYYWNRYRQPVIIVTGFLSVLFLIYVYRRLTGPKQEG